MRTFLLFFLFLIPFFSQLHAQEATVKLQPGRMVFKLKPEFRTAIYNQQIRNEKLNQALTEIGASAPVQKYPKAILMESNPEAVDLTLIYQVKINEKANFEKARNLMLQTGLMTYVEQLRSYEPLYQTSDPLADSVLVASAQTHLKRIRAYRGWDFEKGDSSVVIGILDTGIRYTHNDLKDNIKKNYADKPDGIDNDGDGFIDNFRGWDVADNDNNATADLDGHGIAVTGIASATTDNAKLVAGVGFKSRFLPIKIYPSTPNGFFAGFEGIVYAADHGCSVINLSWGGYVAPSAYELDVVTYAAINRNAVVVAAAGNTNAKLNFHPSSYLYVLSVGSLNEQNIKSANFTYSHQIDLAAPGEGVVTTWASHDSSLIKGGGSSLACPMVAGTAALVKRKFPQYNAGQIAEQIRVTANPAIYALPGNANFQDLLGKGILDVAKALATTNAKSVRFMRVQVDRNDLIFPTDTIKLTVDFKNFLAPLTNLGVTITAVSPYITVLQGSYNAGAMATLATKTNSVPFSIIVAPNTPVNERLNLKFNFTDGTYSDFQYYEFFLNADFVTLNINKLAVTVTSTGNIGFKDLNPELGNGVRFRRNNLLSEGGLMVGNSPTAVSDNIRVVAPKTDTDFFSVNRVHFINALPRADMEAEGMMQDSFPQSAGTLGININYRAYAWQNAPNDKFVILEYRIRNSQPTTLTNLYAGMFADWDVLASAKNRAVWDPANKMGYVYNVKLDTLYAGIKLLTSGVPSFYALDNFNPFSGDINITDGFTTAEKFQALSGGVARSSAGSQQVGNDVSYVIGEKLPDLASNQSGTLAVAIIGGNSLADIQASAQAAQVKYNQRVLGRNEVLTNNGVKIFPNPASNVLQIQLPETFNPAETSIEVLDALGRKVAVSVSAANSLLTINTSEVAAGLYVVKISHKALVQTAKFQIVK